ncbi:universal stress protein [Yoonia sp.]|uniref:universal stress protein n=1 Tax=Yoonia sp. TaxID=2212373 RepID=UPI003F6CA30E
MAKASQRQRRPTHVDAQNGVPLNGPIHHQSDVLVFVEPEQKESGAIRHAQKVAKAFGGHVVLVHVMQPHPAEGGPVDPVDWDIRKQTRRKWLAGLAGGLDDDPRRAATVELLEGPCIAQIESHLEGRQDDIAAVLRANGQDNWRMRDTACGVMASRSAAILMIPQASTIKMSDTYQRILVPLDGSVRSENALPSAATLAKTEGAELVLCYIAPEPGLSAFGTMDPEATKLRSEVTRRNTQAGQTHLARIKNRLAHHDLKISTCIVAQGDVRRALVDTITDQSADFVVMATHGESGHRDVPMGKVASFVLDRAHVPVLLVRHRVGRAENHAFEKARSEGARQPVGTDE